ncbi:TPA: restriction endonuclease subunit S [Neisseria meningitidis]|uniref:restriction endonuclease subunit S n=1 Tax=Neisseria meningitidis TaxID=487 RepID=UPI0002EC1B00|nr:restriction endonuclease subunit S [Neisseria meningitidis]MBG9065816.1 restriction endonuclease subunit S [Neisseria meningitidis]MBG9194199.1 restriction endonuclease subunit S [Neisseria meningitidis]MDM1029171.1 type I restriction-modification system, S subunit [Neisseria meningitidis]RPC95599.1 type I restriction endonuclease subunit S [Neisseria meningitidis]CWS90180.1 putative type I restriction-modification system S protein [Neisseria meningitidis]
MNSALENHATYINNKVDTNEISLSQYISTDNILQNKQGIECATSLPIQGGKVTAFKKGDILLANIRPYLKKIWYAQFDGGCSADVLAIRANAKTDSHFLFYALFRDDFFIHAMKGAKGTKMPRGDKTQIMEFKIPVFDLKTQQSIAAVLSALDKKIALNKQINARLEEMAKTLYDYWFVQFDFPDANGKPYKSSGGDMVFDETLKREIPKGWGSIELQSCLAKIPNTTKILNKDIKDFGKYPVVDQSQDFICGFTNDEKSILNPQDAHIIFGDHTRIVKLVNFQYARGADGTQVILSNNERMPNYLFYQIINQIDLSSYGYARHFKFLKEFKIILPSKDISQKYNEIANTFFVKVRNNLKQNHHLTQLRDFLLPMLMNGQVSVRCSGARDG